MSGVPFPNTSTPAPGEFYQSSFTQPPAPQPIRPAPQSSSSLQSSQSKSQQQQQQQQQQQPQPYYIPEPLPQHPSQLSTTSFEDEPPLLEELGINVSSVLSKAKLVANPFSKIDSSFIDDADMTGPVVLCLLLGCLLLLQRKIQFGVIYGQATVGCIAVYFVFNLMSRASTSGIDLYRVTSILGYSLLPMVLLSFLAVFLPVKTYKVLGATLGGICIFWSTTTASKIFVAVLAMHDQFWLVWYPLALLYTSFAFITVF